QVPAPKPLKFVGNEFAIPIKGIQDEDFLVAREDVGVGQPGFRERSRRKVKLDANVATEEAADFREIRPVCFAEHDTDAPSGSSEGVEQEPKDFWSDRKRTHAEDLAVAREDYLSQLPTNRLGPFVDPQVRIRIPTLWRRCFLQFRDDLGGREQVVMPRLPRLFRDDARGPRPVSVRPLPRDVNPSLGLERLQ